MDFNTFKHLYEKSQWIEINDWKNKKPSVLSEVSGFIFKPVVWIVQKVIPAKAIQGVIEGCNGLSKFLIDNNAFKKECKIENIEDLKSKNLEFCDDLANSVHNWANGIAITEGGITGAAGLPGMAADIPAIITLAFRTINKIGLCYGFENKTEADNQIVLSILSASGANSVAEKQAALLTLKQIQVIIAKTTWKKMTTNAFQNELSKEAGILAIKALAKQLGINLTKRKALQTIPIIGAAVGASVNGSYINDVAWAARRVFQEAWLNEKYIVIE
jgi:phosphohistidine swiveling domain-containing protein